MNSPGVNETTITSITMSSAASRFHAAASFCFVHSHVHVLCRLAANLTFYKSCTGAPDP